MKGIFNLGAVATAGLFAAAITLSACDTATPDDSAQASLSESSSDLATVLMADLGLTAIQQSDVADLFQRFGGGTAEPGYLWTVAADLQQRLTDEQKQRLFEKPARRDGEGFGPGGGAGFPGRGRRGGFGPGTAGPGFGQSEGHGAGPLAEILTDEQKEQVETIRESVREKLEAIRAGVTAGEISREEAHEQAEAIRESVREQIEALLTDDQKAQLEALIADRQSEREARRSEAGAVRNEVLGLTDDEAASFDAISATLREAATAIRDQVRSGGLAPDEAHEAMDALRDQRYDDLAALLDDTQLDIVKIHDALRVRMRHHGMKGSGGQGRMGRGFRPGGPGMGSGGGFGFGSRG